VTVGERRRRPTERRNRDQQILESAVKIFSSKGYTAASLQDVADMVGLLKGSLYHYIPSKENLLFRIFQQAHDEAVVLMAEIDALGLPPEKRLANYVERLTLWYLENRDRASLYFTEWRYLTGEYADTVRDQRRAFEHYLRNLVTEVKQAGFTRDSLEPKLASFYILSAVNSVPVWYRPTGPSTPEMVAAQVAELACATVFGNPKPRRAGKKKAD
jgi:AcrR family transcriptional regulator